MPACPFPSLGWPRGFWMSLSASHVLLEPRVLSLPQCLGEGGDGAGGGAKLVMGLSMLEWGHWAETAGEGASGAVSCGGAQTHKPAKREPIFGA